MPQRTLAATPPPARALWLHRPLAAVVLVVGIAIALVVGQGLTAAERERAEAAFGVVAEEYADDFERAFARTLVAIGGVSDLIAIEGIEAPDFETASGWVQGRHPSLPALGLARAVADVQAWEASAGQQGLVRPTRSGAALFLERVAPADGDHAAAVGFDLRSEARRRAAIEAAIDGGIPVASAPVPIVPVVAEEGLGATLVIPAFHGGHAPDSIDERRARFSGAVVAVLSPRVVLDALAAPHVRVEVWDVGTATDAAGTGPTPVHMVSSDGTVVSDGEAEGEGLRQRLTVDVAGRRWMLVVDDLAGMATSGSAWLRIGIPAGGTVIALLAAALVLLGGESLRRSQRDRALLELRVEARTADLAQLAAVLERSNRELEGFVYGAAHDLRTPLAIVHGALAWVAARAGLGELEHELVSRARAATDRMRCRIDALVRDASGLGVADAFPEEAGAFPEEAGACPEEADALPDEVGSSSHEVSASSEPLPSASTLGG